MKDKFIFTYMEVTKTFSQLSYSDRLKVGAIIVKDDKVISFGYNGTPIGWKTNCCEVGKFITFEEYNELPKVEQDKCCTFIPTCEESKYYAAKLVTKPEVVHAEMNCISKLAKSTESGENSIMFLTHSPCMECAKMIYHCGVLKIYFENKYRDDSGIKFLKQCGVDVYQVYNSTIRKI